MDLTFDTQNGTFNYRVGGLLIRNGELLVMRSQESEYYLPGGRVKLHETAEEAIVREIKEELAFDAVILRPLWINQAFLIDPQSKKKFHEICVYFLLDAEAERLIAMGQAFVRYEAGQTHRFEWIPFNRLKEKGVYPSFLADRIDCLPAMAELCTESEYQRERGDSGNSIR